MRRTVLRPLLASALAAPLVWIGCSGSDQPSGSTSSSSSSSSSSGAGGSGGSVVEPATYTNATDVEARLKKTLADLAAFGSKRAGTDAGKQAGDYMKQRFADGGLADATFEPFSFLSFDLASSSLAVTIAGSPVMMAHDVFQYSGKGSVDADVIDVG